MSLLDIVIGVIVFIVGWYIFYLMHRNRFGKY